MSKCVHCLGIIHNRRQHGIPLDSVQIGQCPKKHRVNVYYVWLPKRNDIRPHGVLGEGSDKSVHYIWRPGIHTIDTRFLISRLYGRWPLLSRAGSAPPIFGPVGRSRAQFWLSPGSPVKTLNYCTSDTVLLEMQKICCMFVFVVQCPPTGWSNFSWTTKQIHMGPRYNARIPAAPRMLSHYWFLPARRYS